MALCGVRDSAVVYLLEIQCCDGGGSKHRVGGRFISKEEECHVENLSWKVLGCSGHVIGGGGS